MKKNTEDGFRKICQVLNLKEVRAMIVFEESIDFIKSQPLNAVDFCEFAMRNFNTDGEKILAMTAWSFAESAQLKLNKGVVKEAVNEIVKGVFFAMETAKEVTDNDEKMP